MQKHFNSGSTIYPNYPSLVNLLRLRTQQQPDHLAYTLLADGETNEVNLTYAELEHQSRAIASQLQASSPPGERVLLLYPPGLEYITAFFGCLYAQMVAVPAYLPRNPRSLPRIQAIVTDAQASVVLTTTATLSKLETMLKQVPQLQSCQWITSDRISGAVAANWQAPDINLDTLAFLQYTSGSTGIPKGVMLSHGNLLYNSALIAEAFEFTPEDKVVTWLPPYHDMGLIGGILQPLYSGGTCILMSPVSFLQRPLRWLEAITRFQATISGGPNFAYELCLQRITSEQRATLDLSSWEVAFNGAEPIRTSTLDRFAETFAVCGFQRKSLYPCYGLAEATLIVSGGRRHQPPVMQTIKATALQAHQAIASQQDGKNQQLVGCGQTLPGQQILIVHSEKLTCCLPGEVGEIWVAGKSVAQGYWNRIEETQQTFHADLADTKAGSFLRTGDLGFLHQGELFVTGRLKDLIIIRGRNYYPQDIELTVEQSHPALRSGCGAAFAVEVAGIEQLAIAQEVERHFLKQPLEPVIQAIRQAVATEHDIQVYAVLLLKPGTVPKTSSGKIQRRACCNSFLTDQLETIQEWRLDTETVANTNLLRISRDALLAIATLEQRQTLLKTYICQQVASALKVPVAMINSEQPLNNLGLDSLMAVELKNRIETDLAIALPLVSFLEGTSITQLVKQILTELATTNIKAPLATISNQMSQHPQQLLANLEQLSQAEVDVLLTKMLTEEESLK